MPQKVTTDGESLFVQQKASTLPTSSVEQLRLEQMGKWNNAVNEVTTTITNS